MDFYSLVATLSLIVQVIVIATVIVGYEFKRRLKYRLHGLFMASALIIHLVFIFAIMVPSFVLAIIPLIQMQPTSLMSIISPIHALLGAISVSAGLWIVLSWRFRKSLNFCLPRKRVMLPTLLTWLATLLLGVVLYFVLYWALIFG
jgi:uncharacterized membrane protein YozB (DUF420 family)